RPHGDLFLQHGWEEVRYDWPALSAQQSMAVFHGVSIRHFQLCDAGFGGCGKHRILQGGNAMMEKFTASSRNWLRVAITSSDSTRPRYGIRTGAEPGVIPLSFTASTVTK